LTVTNPIRFAGRGGPFSQVKLPALTAILSVIGGAIPATGYSFQFNFLSQKSFTQLCFFIDSPQIGYGAGAVPAALFDTGGPANIYLEPQGTPQAADIPQGVASGIFNSGQIYIVFDFSGDKQFELKYVDSTTNEITKDVVQNFLEPPAMMAVEPVGQGSGALFNFQTGAFRLKLNSPDVLNALAGENPTYTVDENSGKPVIWAIGTEEGSNLKMLLEQQVPNSITVDYLLA